MNETPYDHLLNDENHRQVERLKRRSKRENDYYKKVEKEFKSLSFEQFNKKYNII